MKSVLATLIVFLILAGCKSSENKNSISMPGAYQMLSQTAKSDSTDTTFHNAQLKIYTGDHMMYANINSPDSVSGFGLASYGVEGDTVTENVFYYANNTAASTTPIVYRLFINKTDKGFQQVIKGMEDNAGEKFDLTEKYDSVGSDIKTPLDGAWKQVARYRINGKDTTREEVTQYKTYYAGYCIWGNNWKDSANKMHTGIGFGKFTMPSPNKVKESMTASTFYEVRGKDFDIDVEMTGNDKFRQVMHNQDGSKSIEEYERLKK
jgi:hypothetical protein